MVLTAALAPLPAIAADSGAARGNFLGSGRACYGMLTITSRAITWMTPFSRCRTSRYTITDRRDGADGLSVTYQLTNPSATCRYSVLMLAHKAGPDADLGWDVVGYPSLASAAEGRQDKALGCYLYRE